MAPYTQQGLTVGLLTTPQGRLLAGEELHDPSYRATVEVQGARRRSRIGRVVAGFPLDATTSERLTEQAGDEDVTVGFSVDDQVVRPDGAQQGGVPATPGRGAVDASIVGTDYRFASLDLPDASPPAELLALYPSAKIDEANDDLRLRVALVVLHRAARSSCVLSEVVVRSITGQLGVYERRAKEVGEGKFAGSVPVHGNDEFAKFAVALQHDVSGARATHRRARERAPARAARRRPLRAGARGDARRLGAALDRRRVGDGGRAARAAGGC